MTLSVDLFLTGVQKIIMKAQPVVLRTLLASAAAFAVAGSVQAQELNLYTSREPGLVEPLLQAFTESTGIKVNTVFLKDGVAERVASEGESSPADVLMAVDVGNLVDLVDRGLTQPVES